MDRSYVHGYETNEHERLEEQASILADILHADIGYPAGSLVLEAGCGVGAQTVTLARRSPGASFTSIDLSAASLAAAERAMRTAGLGNVRFRHADILDPPFADESFDHIFICFVLEHLPRPDEALSRLGRLLRPGGTMAIIEGDHGSTLFHPESGAARTAIQALVELQKRAGGDALIGRRIYPLMVGAGLREVRVSPSTIYVDASRPDFVRGFTEKTFIAMVEGIRDAALSAGLVDPDTFDAGIRDLRKTTRPEGTFCYTFFKGIGEKTPVISGGMGRTMLKD